MKYDKVHKVFQLFKNNDIFLIKNLLFFFFFYCMAHRCSFENSNDIGVFSKLTNGYCLVSVGGNENFYSIFESELGLKLPVIHCTIGGTRLVGRLT